MQISSAFFWWVYPPSALMMVTLCLSFSMRAFPISSGCVVTISTFSACSPPFKMLSLTFEVMKLYRIDRITASMLKLYTK